MLEGFFDVYKSLWWAISSMNVKSIVVFLGVISLGILGVLVMFLLFWLKRKE